MSATSAPVNVPNDVAAESAAEPIATIDPLPPAETMSREPVPNGEDATPPVVSSADPVQESNGVKSAKSAELIAAAALPPVLRERLAQLALANGDSLVDGSPRLPLEACLRAIEESLPECLRPDRASLIAAAHPNGEVFFHGQSEELSDSEAEEVARRQLARSGLLRGQRGAGRMTEGGDGGEAIS